MKRLKKQKIAIQERVRILASTNGMICKDGKLLEPGTPEYLQFLEKMAGTLSEEEFQGLVSAGTKSKDSDNSN